MDFFKQAISLKHSDLFIKDTLNDIYSINRSVDKNIFFGVNLQWPSFALPKNYSRYFISFHTEYIDIAWVIEQAKNVYPKSILLVVDFKFPDKSIIPDNVNILQFITLHHQIGKSIEKFGINSTVKIPRYKISSLAARVSQYKKFITAYLLKNFPKEDMIITYRDQLGKIEDHHAHPDIAYLNVLDLKNISRTFINFDEDNFVNTPVNNSNWHLAPYLECAFNLTNESFHYSDTMFCGRPFRNPGPYITEKSFKPFLAGQAFISVGQAGSHQFFQDLGFRTDFGVSQYFDSDFSDLTRIKKIFDSIDQIQNTRIDLLHEQSLDAIKHNLNHIKSGTFVDHVCSLNKSCQQIISNY